MNQNYWNNGGPGWQGGSPYSFDPMFGGMPPRTDPGKGKATAALVLGILSIVLMSLAAGIVGIVLANQSKNATRMAGFPPNGSATAGMICSVIGTALSAIVIVAFFGLI